tara:strand:+ start:1867 stop:2319 length:453 start_codon:yes stop_codon:yes gene_type:complete
LHISNAALLLACPSISIRVFNLSFNYSDSNFRQDKFLRAESGKNDEGFVPLAVSIFQNSKKLRAPTILASLALVIVVVLSLTESGCQSEFLKDAKPARSILLHHLAFFEKVFVFVLLDGTKLGIDLQLIRFSPSLLYPRRQSPLLREWSL